MRFRRPELLREAMTHASWNNEQGRISGPGHDNERLEYLGDAVLELVVGEFLFRRFPTYDEGQLTQLRANLVNTYSLARLAEKLEIGDALMLGKGAAKTGANRLPSLLANAFEAMIGAIFLDQGYRVATRVFLHNIGNLDDWSDENHKGRLQEAAQDRTGMPPIYRVESIGGPGHRRQYTADAVVGGNVLGTGTGTTKQAAEQAAARAAVDALAATRSTAPPRPSRAAGASSRGRRRVTAAEVEKVAAAAAEALPGEAALSTAPAPAPARSRRRGGRAPATGTPAPPALPPAPAPAAAAGYFAVPARSVPATPATQRRRGLLATLRSAAEALVGRRSDAHAVAEPSVAAAAPAPELPAVEAPAGGEGADAETTPRSRRGHRGGRGRRRPAGAGDPGAAPTAESAAGAAGGPGAERPQRAQGPSGSRRASPTASAARAPEPAAPGEPAPAPPARRRRSPSKPAVPPTDQHEGGGESMAGAIEGADQPRPTRSRSRSRRGRGGGVPVADADGDRPS